VEFIHDVIPPLSGDEFATEGDYIPNLSYDRPSGKGLYGGGETDWIKMFWEWLKYQNRISKHYERNSKFKTISEEEANRNWNEMEKYKKEMYGGNLFSDIYSVAKNYAMSPSLLQRSLSAFDVLMKGRHKFTPSSQKILEEYGNLPITEMEISRHPIENVMRAVNFFTNNELKKLVDKSEYDTLYHLGLFVKVGDTWIEVEKEATVTLTVNKPKNLKAEIMVIDKKDIPEGLTLNILMANAQAHLKGNFFNYQARSANCQDFVRGVLWASNIRQEKYRKFVIQDVQGLFNESSNPEFYRKATNTLTDLGHVFHTFYEGGNI